MFYIELFFTKLVIPQNNGMKIINSPSISPFGGLNFVLEYFENEKLGHFFNNNLPKLSASSVYSWKDILYTFFSIYYCNGEYLEDINTILKDNIGANPFCNMTSPDTVVRRFKELDAKTQTCRTPRGKVEHSFSYNELLTRINIELLQKLGVFKSKQITIDYDNTIIFSQKEDCKMTYKKDYGYQPGICTINERHILYIENRDGNSSAKSYQAETLERMFIDLSKHDLPKINNFRADAASYQFGVIQLIEQHVDNFYIGAKNSYVEKYYKQVAEWEEIIDSKGDKSWVGEIHFTPFIDQSKKKKVKTKEYRLIVKRKLKRSGQLNIITQDAYEYRSIVTNDEDSTAIEIRNFYNNRGDMERVFDVMKNDFGWKNMPFSKLSYNTVFLYFSAMAKNIYNHLIINFASKYTGITTTSRMKRFVFKIILIPAKWVKKARQSYLKIFGEIGYRT